MFCCRLQTKSRTLSGKVQSVRAWLYGNVLFLFQLGIFVQANKLGYLSTDIICSKKGTMKNCETFPKDNYASMLFKVRGFVNYPSSIFCNRKCGDSTFPQFLLCQVQSLDVLRPTVCDQKYRLDFNGAFQI